MTAEPRLLTIRTSDPHARPLAGFYELAGPDQPADIVMEPQTAIATAIADYRDRILRDDSIQLLNVETAVERLTRLAVSALTVPLADEDGLLAVEMWTDRGFDRIQMASLCGDMLGFRPPQDLDAFRPIVAMLESWTGISAIAWFDTLYRSALKRLARKDAVTAFSARGGDGDLLVRMAAVFTALRAWRDRAGERERRAAVIDVAGTAGESDGPWRVPIDLLVSGTGPDRLSGFERDLCVRYANEVLHWDGVEPKYPAWLRA